MSKLSSGLVSVCLVVKSESRRLWMDGGVLFQGVIWRLTDSRNEWNSSIGPKPLKTPRGHGSF